MDLGLKYIEGVKKTFFLKEVVPPAPKTGIPPAFESTAPGATTDDGDIYPVYRID
jgi:hypothetical protein